MYTHTQKQLCTDACTYMHTHTHTYTHTHTHAHAHTHTHRFAQQLCSALGFDWLMLFMDKSIHTETVVRSLRILVQLLCEPSLQAKFHEGDIFGTWVIGFETISTEMTQMLSQSLLYFNPLRQSVHLPQIPVPGAILLAQLLPHHAHLSQVRMKIIRTLSCVCFVLQCMFLGGVGGEGHLPA